MKRFILAVLFTFLYATAASAQTVSGQIDLSPVWQSGIALVGSALSGIAIWIGWYVKNLVASKVDLSQTQLDEQIQQMYNEAAQRAIAYAETFLQQKAPTKVNVGNEFVATAAEYLIKFWPDLVKKAGLTPEKVKETIVSRLPSDAAEKAEDITLAKAGTASPLAPTK